MASITISGPPEFSEGTTVNAYLATQAGPEFGAPHGTAAAAGTVISGSLTFNALLDDTNYVAYAAGRYKRFRTTAGETANAPGSYLGPYDTVPVGTSVQRNDTVSNQGVLWTANTSFTLNGTFTEDWTSLSVGIPTGGSVGQVLTQQPGGALTWQDPVTVSPGQLAGKVDTALVGAANGIATLGADGLLTATQRPPGTVRPVWLPISVPGDLSVGAGQARIPVPVVGTIASVEATLGTDPSGQAVIVDVNKNGSTIFSTQANRPQIGPGSHTSGLKTPNVTSLTAGDYLTIDVDQVGAASPSAPVFITQESQGAVTATSIDVTRPAGISTGDLVYLEVVAHANLSLAAPPSGWTQIGSVSAIAGGFRIGRYWRIDNGVAGPWTFTATGPASYLDAQKYVYRGTHATAPIDSNSQTTVTGATSHGFTAHTTANPNSVVLATVLFSDLSPVGLVSRDTFTDTAGVLLTAHAGETGAAWTQHPVSVSDAVITAGGAVRGNAGGLALLMSSGTPSAADYSVFGDVVFQSTITQDGPGIVGRLDPTVASYYMARYNPNTSSVELVRSVSGTTAVISSFSGAFTAGTTHNLELRMTGTTIRVFVDGTQRISVTDTQVTAAGRAGVRFSFSGGNVVSSDATGIHIDNFMVGTQAGTPSATTAATPSGYTARLNFAGTSGSRHAADELVAAAGAATAVTVTSGATRSSVLSRVGLRPAAVGGAVPGNALTVLLRITEG